MECERKRWKSYLAIVVSTVCILIVVGLYSFQLHKKIVEYSEPFGAHFQTRNNSNTGRDGRLTGFPISFILAALITVY